MIISETSSLRWSDQSGGQRDSSVGRYCCDAPWPSSAYRAESYIISPIA